jgi:hypothetical protein
MPPGKTLFSVSGASSCNGSASVPSFVEQGILLPFSAQVVRPRNQSHYIKSTFHFSHQQ